MTAASVAAVPAVPPAGAVPAYQDVACPTWGCPAEGLPRRVPLRVAAPQVLEMPRLVCQRCGYDMARIGAIEVGDDMAKITVHGGASNAAAAAEGQGTVVAPARVGDQHAVGELREHPGTGEPSVAVDAQADVDPAARPDNDPDKNEAEIASAQASTPDQPDNSPNNEPGGKPVPAKKTTRPAAARKRAVAGRVAGGDGS